MIPPKPMSPHTQLHGVISRTAGKLENDWIFDGGNHSRGLQVTRPTHSQGHESCCLRITAGKMEYSCLYVMDVLDYNLRWNAQI